MHQSCFLSHGGQIFFRVEPLGQISVISVILAVLILFKESQFSSIDLLLTVVMVDPYEQEVFIILVEYILSKGNAEMLLCYNIKYKYASVQQVIRYSSEYASKLLLLHDVIHGI